MFAPLFTLLMVSIVSVFQCLQNIRFNRMLRTACVGLVWLGVFMSVSMASSRGFAKGVAMDLAMDLEMTESQSVVMYSDEQTVSLPAVEMVDLSQLPQHRVDQSSPQVLEVDLKHKTVSSPKSVMIDLSQQVFQKKFVQQTGHYYRSKEIPTSLTEALSVHWGLFLAALVDGQTDIALQSILDWKKDFKRLDSTPEEKNRAQRGLVQQLSQLGLYPLAKDISELPCAFSPGSDGAIKSCPSLSPWAQSMARSEKWPTGAIDEYLEDLGHVLAIATREAQSIESIASQTSYPSILKDALRSWESLSTGDYRKATHQFGWVSHQAPEHPMALVGLGQAQAKEHQWQLAAKTFERAKNQSAEHSHSDLEGLSDRQRFLTGLERTAKGESLIGRGQSFQGRSEQMMGYELLGRYPEIMAHIRQYHCLNVGPLSHRLWAAEQVQQYGLWPESINRFKPAYFRRQEYRYAAALLQARHSVLTGTPQQAQQWYQQAKKYQPHSVMARRGLHFLGGQVQAGDIDRLNDSVWLHRLSDDTLGEAQALEHELAQLKVMQEKFKDSSPLAWSLEEKQYVGQLLRHVFMGKYLMTEALTSFEKELNASQPYRVTWTSQKQKISGRLRHYQNELEHLSLMHQQLHPPAQWRLSYDLGADMLKSDGAYLRQLSRNIEELAWYPKKGEGVVTSAFRLTESRLYAHFFDQHVLRYLRTMPEIEQQRFLFEYELPIDLNVFQALLIEVDRQQVETMGASVGLVTQNSQGVLKEHALIEQEKRQKMDAETEKKLKASQRLRQMMKMTPLK